MTPSKPQILLAEDNPASRQIIRLMLAKLGYEVDVVEDGVAAIKAASESAYSLILMDCNMPLLDGYQATRQIRESESPENRVPIIALTATATKEDETNCLAAGMDHYLSKPVSLQQLSETVQRWARGEHDFRFESPADFGTSSKDVLDADSLRELHRINDQGSRKVMADVVASFAQQSELRLNELREAIARRDPEQVAEIAHSLRGSSAYLAAARMADICAAIEVEARQGSLSTADELTGKLEEEFILVARELRSEF